jgi:ABC-2 type transport system permease protein
VGRLRLVLVKWLAGVVFASVLVLVLGVMAVLFARLWFPWKGMFVFVPGLIFSVLPADEGLARLACAHLFLAVNASTMLGLACMFSCFNMKPAAATILALSVLFLNLVMEGIPFFEPYHDWLLTHHFRNWLQFFNSPIPWWRIAESLSLLLGFNLTFLVVGGTAFHVRDIKS